MISPEAVAPSVDLMESRDGKKPVLVLHIGAGKTGSSSIQTFLGANRKRLASMGILVPNGRMEFSHGMGQQVFFLQGLVGQPNAGQTLKAKVASAIARFGATSLKAIIISAENLSNLHDLHETFAALREDFELCIVFYIRRQEDFYLSAWQQWYAKTGKPHGPWLKRMPDDFADWAGTIDRWDQLRPEHFVVRVYDRSELVNGDVLHDFCAVLRLPIDTLELDKKPTNESFGVHVSTLYSDIAAVFENPHDRNVERLLYEYDVKAAGKKKNETLFTSEELAFIRDKHAAGNKRIKDRFFPDLQGDSPFPHLDHKKLRRPNQEELNRRNIALLAELVFKHMIADQKRNAVVQPASAPSGKSNSRPDEVRPQKGATPGTASLPASPPHNADTPASRGQSDHIGNSAAAVAESDGAAGIGKAAKGRGKGWLLRLLRAVRG